jgi:hypothetical protein
VLGDSALSLAKKNIKVHFFFGVFVIWAISFLKTSPESAVGIGFAQRSND